MNIELAIYLWGILDKIRITLLTFGILTTLFFFISMLFTILDSHCKKETVEKWAKRNKVGLPISVIIIFVAILVPTSNNFAMMFVIPKVVESEAIQKDIPELWEAAVSSLKEKLK